MRHTSASLQFFFEQFPVSPFLHCRIVPIAKRCHVAAQRTTSSLLHRRLQTYVTDLWSLFPSFCVSARDTASTIPQWSTSLLGAMNDKTYLSLSIRICEGFILLIRSNQIAQGSNPFDASNDSEPSDDDTVASNADLAANDEEELVLFCIAASFLASFPRYPQIDACSAHRSLPSLCESGGSAERQRVASARSAVALRAMARRLLVGSAEILGNRAGRRHRDRAGNSLRD